MPTKQKTKKQLVEELSDFVSGLEEYEYNLLFFSIEELEGLYPFIKKEQILKDHLELRQCLRSRFRDYRLYL